MKQLEQDIERKLQDHEVGKLLLTTIDGIGPRTVACLIAELGDPSRFRDAAALASYVGVGAAFCGNRANVRSPAREAFRSEMRACVIGCGCGHCAVRRNPWLRAHYNRLLPAGKRPKVALGASMRKLLTAVYSVARNRQPFVPHPSR